MPLQLNIFLEAQAINMANMRCLSGYLRASTIHQCAASASSTWQRFFRCNSIASHILKNVQADYFSEIATIEARPFSRRSYPRSSAVQMFGFSSSASPQLKYKESIQNLGFDSSKRLSMDESHTETVQNADGGSEQRNQNTSDRRRKRRVIKRIAFSDSDEEPVLSVEELSKKLAEKKELLKSKNKEIEKLQEELIGANSEMENVVERTKCEAENAKNSQYRALRRAYLMFLIIS